MYISQKLLKLQLSAWCFYTIKSIRDIKLSHIEFENIHPFEDGNGRVGRILMNIQCLNAGLPLLVIHTGKEQQKYYTWFDSSK